MATRIVISGDAQKHIDAYIEYRNIVGDADGGKLLSEEEYAEFKRRAMIARQPENRIYVAWANSSSGLECRMIGPQSKCFCTHRYRDHATDNFKDKNIHCRVPGCKCRLFEHVPVRGTQDLKCHCKHSYEVHQCGTAGHPCKNCSCKAFQSSFACTCGDAVSKHETIFETRAEREALGKPVDNLADGGAGYAAMGGLTHFSSLVDGVERYAAPGLPSSANGLAQDDYFAGATGGSPERKKGKLTMDDEMAIYAAKYDKKKSFRAPVNRKPTAKPLAFGQLDSSPAAGSNTAGSRINAQFAQLDSDASNNGSADSEQSFDNPADYKFGSRPAGSNLSSAARSQPAQPRQPAAPRSTAAAAQQRTNASASVAAASPSGRAASSSVASASKSLAYRAYAPGQAQVDSLNRTDAAGMSYAQLHADAMASEPSSVAASSSASAPSAQATPVSRTNARSSLSQTSSRGVGVSSQRTSAQPATAVRVRAATSSSSSVSAARVGQARPAAAAAATRTGGAGAVTVAASRGNSLRS